MYKKEELLQRKYKRNCKEYLMNNYWVPEFLIDGYYSQQEELNYGN